MSDYILEPPFVQIRRWWVDKWQTVIDLEADAWDNTLSPGMPGARLRYHYGRIQTPYGGQSDLERVVGSKLQWYVRIMRPPTEAEWLDSQTTAKPVAVWHGVLLQGTDLRGGVDPVATGDEMVNVRGLEVLLARAGITGSMFESGSARVEIKERLPFNLRNAQTGSLKGNRSSTKYDGPGGVESYVFSDDDGSVWSAADVAEYLIAQYGPDGLGITMASTDGLANLAKQEEAWPPFDNIYTGLNTVVRRNRGHAWHIAVDDEGFLSIEILPIFSADVREGGVEMNGAADANLIEMDLSDNTSLPGSALAMLAITDNAEAQFDRIRVEGGPLILVDTLDFSGSPAELVAAWSGDQETAYEAANDIGRAAAKFAHVFTSFRVTPSQLIAGPTVQDDGSLSTDTTPTSSYLGKVFLRQLPLLVTDDDASGPIAFRKPLVYVKFTGAGGDTYAPLGSLRKAHPEMPNCPVKMLDGEMGFHIVIGINHLLASGHAAGIAALVQPKLDYENIEATVAWASSERLRYVVDVNNEGVSAAPRTLVLRVPDAQAWWRAPNVTVDIVDGARSIEGNSSELRNDKARLAAVAALAKSWYSRTHRTATVTFSTLIYDYSPGDVITRIIDEGGSASEVQTAVSRVSWDSANGSTTVQTDFVELDFVSAAGQGRAGGGRMPAIGLAPPVGAPRVGQEPDNLPAVDAGGVRTVAEHGKPTAAFTSGATITLNPVDIAGADIPGMENVVVYLAVDKSSVTVSYADSDVLSFIRFEGNDGTADGVLAGLVAAEDEAKVKVSSNDTTADYLLSKIVDDTIWTEATQVNDAGDEDLKLAHIGPQGGAHAWTRIGSRGGGKDVILAYDDNRHFLGWWDSKGANWKGGNDFKSQAIAEPTSTTALDIPAP